MTKPLDPGFPDGLLALWLVSELFVGYDLFQLREHLGPDHHAKCTIRYRNRGLLVCLAHLYDRP